MPEPEVMPMSMPEPEPTYMHEPEVMPVPMPEMRLESILGFKAVLAHRLWAAKWIECYGTPE